MGLDSSPSLDLSSQHGVRWGVPDAFGRLVEPATQGIGAPGGEEILAVHEQGGATGEAGVGFGAHPLDGDHLGFESRFGDDPAYGVESPRCSRAAVEVQELYAYFAALTNLA